MSKRILSVLLLAGLAGSALAARGGTSAAAPVEIEESKVSIEWNSTADDYGVQFFWDGSPWKSMTVRDQSGNLVLDVSAKGRVRTHGLTETFFESSEPPASVLSREAFFERFPEGEYAFRGTGLDGSTMVGDATFTHVLPAPPKNLFPSAGATVSPAGFTATFDPVVKDVDGNAVDIASYEVIVEKEDEEPILQVLDVILRPSQTSVAVAAQFLEPDTSYIMEVIAVERGGNKTITESGSFRTSR